ncbi:MAG: hypothetical protein KBC57_03190 [Neisseriaceae bacterium]|nr:hypothetical protein [Neisseriaceae bacterium]
MGKFLAGIILLSLSLTTSAESFKEVVQKSELSIKSCQKKASASAAWNACILDEADLIYQKGLVQYGKRLSEERDDLDEQAVIKRDREAIDVLISSCETYTFLSSPKFTDRANCRLGSSKVFLKYFLDKDYHLSN